MRMGLTSRTGRCVVASVLGITILFPAKAWAQALEYSLTSATLKMVGVLAVVLAVFLGLVFILKKISPLFGRGAVFGREIELLTQYPLGSKKVLTVVRVGEKLLLLGVTEKNINLLTEIKDPDQIRRLINKESGPAQGFGRILKKAGKKLKEGADR